MHTHTFLLVDDSSTTEQEVRSALAGEPLEIVVVTSGLSALDRIESHRPDIVLASTTAAGVDGYELAHYVWQRPSLNSVSVLLLTGEVTPTDLQRMKKSGARGILGRPIEPGKMLALVQELMLFPGPALADVDVLGQLTPAFDAIDASMTGTAPGGSARENPITPEVLARIVADAVTHALAAYERARSGAPAPNSTIGSGRPSIAVQSLNPTEQQRLQREMGLNDIKFEPQSPPPAAAGDRVREALPPDVESDFAFGIDDLPPLERAPRTFAPWHSTGPEADRRSRESTASAMGVIEPLRNVVASLGTALADRASRFRASRAGRAQRRADDRTVANTPVEPVPQEPRED